MTGERANRAIRAIGLAAAFAGLALFAWLSVQVYRAQADPENFEAWRGEYAWIVGPTSKSLNRVANDRIARGLETLNDLSLPAAERLSRYRAQLAAADKLLVRSLRANPAQALALSQLAAIRWETEVPADEAAQAKYLDMIAVASKMAPRVPDVQARLGELLLKMGRQDAALTYLRRTIDLDPGQASKVVGFLRDQLLTAPEIAAALPKVPAVLAALAGPYFAEGRGKEYLDLAEGAVTEGAPDLLETWAWACMSAGEPARLAARLEKVGALRDPPLEARRLRLRSAARLALGDRERACDDARAARSLQPKDPGVAQHLGNVMLQAGRPDEAVKAFRNALSLVSRGSGDKGWRAGLYSAIGGAEEARGKPDVAYDAYRKAVDLDPGQEGARRRLAEMEKAAGIPPRQ